MLTTLEQQALWKPKLICHEDQEPVFSQAPKTRIYTGICRLQTRAPVSTSFNWSPWIWLKFSKRTIFGTKQTRHNSARREVLELPQVVKLASLKKTKKSTPTVSSLTSSRSVSLNSQSHVRINTQWSNLSQTVTLFARQEPQISIWRLQRTVKCQKCECSQKLVQK